MRCANCQTELQPGDRFCGACGQAVVAADSAEADTDTGHCPHCGAQLRAGSRFCGRCGQEVQAATASSIPAAPPVSRCPNCGQPFQPGEQFCGHCGTRLATLATAPVGPPARPRANWLARLPVPAFLALALLIVGAVGAGAFAGLSRLLAESNGAVPTQMPLLAVPTRAAGLSAGLASPIASPSTALVPTTVVSTTFATSVAVVTPAPSSAPTPTRQPTPTPNIDPTPTPRPTPTPAAAPTPPAVLNSRVILSDDFSDPLRGRLPARSINPASYTLDYVDDEYRLQIDPSYRFVPLIRPDGVYRDSIIQIDGRIVGPTENRFIGVGCRDTLGNEGSNEYRFILYPATGVFRFSRWDKGVETLLAMRPAPSAKLGNEMNRIHFRCAGTTITAWVNDVEVTSIEDGTHQQGWMWIGAGHVSSDTPAATEARFDNLFVREPNP